MYKFKMGDKIFDIYYDKPAERFEHKINDFQEKNPKLKIILDLLNPLVKLQINKLVHYWINNDFEILLEFEKMSGDSFYFQIANNCYGGLLTVIGQTLKSSSEYNKSDLLLLKYSELEPIANKDIHAIDTLSLNSSNFLINPWEHKYHTLQVILKESKDKSLEHLYPGFWQFFHLDFSNILIYLYKYKDQELRKLLEKNSNNNIIMNPVIWAMFFDDLKVPKPEFNHYIEYSL